ncbi:MAG: clostripain-related cysteine peptidase [Bacteroidota bacterium]
MGRWQQNQAVDDISHAARTVIIGLLVAVCASSGWRGCTPAAAATPGEWTILAHLDVRGGLSEAAISYEKQLRTAAGAGHFGLSLEIVGEGQPQLRRGVLSGSRLELGPASPAATSAQTLADFIAWSCRQAPARHYALLVMGHGAGLIQQQALPGDALKPEALQEGLKVACSTLGRPIDVVALDTCYGATLELAYGLRGVTRYLTAAPGLIYSPGLDWAGALADLSVQPQATALVQGLVRRGMLERGKDVALVGLDLRGAEPAVAQVLKLTAALERNFPQEQPLLTYARAQCASWGEQDELADLGELGAGLAALAASAETRAAARDLQASLNRLVISSWRSGSNPQRSGSGLGVYFPPTFEPVPAGYARNFGFAAASGWANLLDSYWTRLASMITDGVAP